MADYEVFRLQVTALGLKVQSGRRLEQVFREAQKLTGQEDVDLGDPRLMALWSALTPEKLSLDWPAGEYQPEPALRKRALLLAEEAVAELQGRYPTAGFKPGEKWRHLVQHGKLGLMAALFAVEQRDKSANFRNVAPLVEVFMLEIEKHFEELLLRRAAEEIARALRLPAPAGSFEELVHGRLQPFSLMRSLYFEGANPGLRPLVWWVNHERYIPDLPTSAR